MLEYYCEVRVQIINDACLMLTSTKQCSYMNDTLKRKVQTKIISQFLEFARLKFSLIILLI